ncbi:MAG: cupin domain-containing protein [Kiritimatiellae bacterium]|nr:cupin domain-containing protein [Kiritimatiellia bacterium]
MIRRKDEMNERPIENCHEGTGVLMCRTVLKGGDSEVGIRFMHDDILEPGATIGEHPHEGTEEIYFVVEGQGMMVMDGRRFPIGPGDVSLVERGHTHGIVNSDEAPMRLLVIGVK